MKTLRPFCAAASLLVAATASTLSAADMTPIRVQTPNGSLEGLVSTDGAVRAFKGIPYAAPPVGRLRWQPPQPAKPWQGVRPAHDFGPRAMQAHLWDDMIFHDAGPSEDCLYLNVWSPNTPATEPLPVMVWIHGGGFVAGATSEPRQYGDNLARRGVIVVSLNYRMGVFGFFAHPELAGEAATGATGNYGLLDMVAALEWVRDNIAAFGGDPGNVTIFGESAGSMAVSLLMASPEAADLFHQAIGESGSTLTRDVPSRGESAQAGLAFAEAIGSPSLSALRGLPADELMQLSTGAGTRFGPNVDGHFLIEDPANTFAAGRQAQVPLLAGWNLDEGGDGTIFGNRERTLANYEAAARARFGHRADAFLAAYAATTDAEAVRAAQDFGGDQFIAYSTWQWLEAHNATSAQPTWRYLFDHPVPLSDLAQPGEKPRAAHSWEIEYVFDVIASKNAPWTEADHRLADLMADYWTNFAKQADPNGPGLPEWPVYDDANDHAVMHLNPAPHVTSDDHRARYEFMKNLSTRR